MSQSIYICAASLCCTLIVCSLFKIIAPSGSTAKIMSVVICVFFLCCLVSPLYELTKSIKIKDSGQISNSISAEKFSTEYDSKVLDTTGEYINQYVNSMLKSCSVEDANIETVLSVDKERGIYIDKVNIYLSRYDNDTCEKINDLIFSALGIKPNIMEHKHG